jgi:fused signal recognition particle receptor
MALFKEKKTFFGKLKESIGESLGVSPKITEEVFDNIEEALILADIGLETSEKIVGRLRENVRVKKISDKDGVINEITDIIANLIDKKDALKMSENYPLLILLVGVNGTGKTTMVAKLSKYYKEKKMKTALIAADTFRAAATKQLTLWAEKLELPIIKRTEGEDPGAVIYDAVNWAKENPVDILICDTAGRLQTKKNLMAELAKIDKIISKNFPEISRENLLVLDATTGKNAVSQAKEFSEVSDITGIVLTKLDGTTKGGIVITISDEFNLPIKFIGTGEKLLDVSEFNPENFAKSIFE